jgi:hypothetical protein
VSFKSHCLVMNIFLQEKSNINLLIFADKRFNDQMSGIDDVEA